jgi:hypothetical protein
MTTKRAFGATRATRSAACGVHTASGQASKAAHAGAPSTCARHVRCGAVSWGVVSWGVVRASLSSVQDGAGLDDGVHAVAVAVGGGLP